MTMYALSEIVSLARKNSPIYRQLYEGINLDVMCLEKLPILTHEQLMRVVQDEEAIRFFSSESIEGIVYQSSATTGQPKATLFGRDEWRTTVQMLATNHWRSSTLQAGDIVANLCVGGSASFMFVHGTIENFPGSCCELPLGSDHEFDYLVNTWRKFSVNVVAAINSTVIGLAYHLTLIGERAPEIKRILCGGELFYGNQLALVKRAFPDAEIIPFMYATTETGLIGLAESGFAQNVFCVCPEACVLEIVHAETKEVIHETGRMGLAVVTSLLRTAAPAIRVEVGDYAQWIDPPGTARRRFSIHGRRYLKEYQFFNTSITETDAYRIISHLEENVGLLKFKLELHEHGAKFVVACDDEAASAEAVREIILDAIGLVKPSAVVSREDVHVELVDFSYFLEGIRRKGRIIADQRAL
ncbi:hypothetical protein OP492_08355 [Pseudomonas mosselii]|uniref:hypothetical protein n=1 Tax=Pseudomonas mosselii TaxID=78327 RepID=UPI0021A712B6|nr:hypothetical protein [Pseudomonas mosselii]MEA3234662.1 hypothetical protein [Pseudomonas mosselii]UWS65791.1 hypothetical protein N0U38_18665 [Pseudomonas mosselii]